MTDKLDKSPEDAPPPGGTVTKDAASGPPPEAIKAIPVRHYGRWVSGVVVLALLVALAYAFSQGNIRWATVGNQLFVSSVVQGAGRTLLISVLAMIVGVVLGIVLAVMRLSKNPVTSTVAWLYIWFFRGTPVYVQLLLWFNLALIFPVLNLGPIYKNEMTDVMTPFMCALLGLGLNEAAYMAEICRAGLLAVDEGQTEASHALGMSHTKTLFRIVIPQAMRVIVPPTGNEFINMLKTSSLVYAVTYNELLRSTSAIGSTSYAVMELLFVASIWYLAMTSVFSVFQYYLERYYARGSSRSLPPTVFHKIKANLFGLGRERGRA